MAKVKMPRRLPKPVAAMVWFRKLLTPVWLTHRGTVGGMKRKVVFTLECGHPTYLADADQVASIGFPADDLPEKLFEAADLHGANAGDWDYSVGDLQEVIRALWANMTVHQRAKALSDERMQGLAEIPEYIGLIPLFGPDFVIRANQPPLPV